MTHIEPIEMVDAFAERPTAAPSIASASIVWATGQLGALPADQLAALRVYAGDHLATIIATAAIGSPPVAIESERSPIIRFDAPTTVAFALRSLAGAVRQVLGTDEFGATRDNRFTTLSELVGRMSIEITAGAAELATLTGPTASRNVFLVAHPFDGVPIEALDHAQLAPVMPPLHDLPGICTVWVLLFPYHLMRWSVVTRTWHDVAFTVDDTGTEASTEPDTILERADNQFRALHRPSEDSPFGYRVN
jgi:hypothetical protein